jgi:hypothetical protein
MGNRDFIEHTYEDVKALGYVANQCDFSILCGRTPTWYSAIKARRLPMTADALLTLSYNIKTQVPRANDSVAALELREQLLVQAEAAVAKKLARFDNATSRELVS